MNTIEFNGVKYTEESVKAMSIEDLLTLRNLVATNLGVGTVKSFKDQETAVAQTIKALEKFESTVAEEGGDTSGEKTKKAAKPKVDKGPRPIPKSAQPKTVKRPTKAMFAKIKKIGEHNGADHGRKDRWDNYKDGMTIIDVIEGNGTEPWDVKNWVEKGIMSTTEPTDEEFPKLRAAWYESKGQVDPEVVKEQKAKERADAKAKRDEEKAAKEKAKADAKAAKEAEAAAKAAEKPAE